MPTHGTGRLVGALYAYAFLDEFVLLYPLYALLFTDAGLTAVQVSALFVLWSATGIVLEVPSGALADAVSRRALLVVAPLVGAAGYALWVIVPSFWAFAAGFVLWGVRERSCPGRSRRSCTPSSTPGGGRDYARVLGRSHTAAVLAVVLATALAAPVFDAGGYPLLGGGSIAAGLLASGAALLLPEQRRQRRQEEVPAGRNDAGDVGELGYVATLREGLREVARVPAVRRAVLLVPAVTALWGSLEEYTSLLVRGTGVATGQVPWWELVLWGGAGLGGLLAGRAAGAVCRPDRRPRGSRRRAPGRRRGERRDGRGRGGGRRFRGAAAGRSGRRRMAAGRRHRPGPGHRHVGGLAGRRARRGRGLPRVRRPGRSPRARLHLRPARPRLPAGRGVGGEGLGPLPRPVGTGDTMSG